MFTALNEFDFALLEKDEFKEDSVREEIIQPILKTLGYTAGGLNRIVRSKTLEHPFVMIGSQERKVRIVPDYLLLVGNKPVWTLDAKAPSETITSGEHVEQTFSYSIHPEIRTHFFALCNGREFVVFEIDKESPTLYFHISEIDKYWTELTELLSPKAFQVGTTVSTIQTQNDTNYYSHIKPLPEITDLRKQSAKRHYGVHPYFTKQVWNVVQAYIKNFSQKGDVVLDPFGGTGVTAIEAHVLGRQGIHIDINPLSVFWVNTLVKPIDLSAFAAAYQQVVNQFNSLVPRDEDALKDALKKYPYPTGVKLPEDSDVDTIEQLFNKQQLAELALLKHLIMLVTSRDIRDTLLLMFSGLLNKVNLTYHASKGRSAGRGNSSIFAYYRYRIAKTPAFIDTLHYFDSRYKKVIAAKKELSPFFSQESYKQFKAYHGTATDLRDIESLSIDYIYTDPPYGSKIQYLDLSTMWTAWLDLDVTDTDYELEVVEGGRYDKSKEDYSDLLAESINELYRVLKFDRWMSFVFADKDPSYWHTIIETAEKAGFEYMGAVSQSNNKTSFKKRQNPSTVLSGQLIINFRKVKNPRSIMKIDLGSDVTDLILETVESVIAQNDGATIEEINNEIITKGIELGFLDLLSKKYDDLSPLLDSYFDLDTDTQKYHLPRNKKFKSAIDVDLRIRYFLLSYLKRMRQQDIDPSFDDIVLNIMPLLINGLTPETQTILNVLEDVAQKTKDGNWRVKDGKQLRMDGF